MEPLEDCLVDAVVKTIEEQEIIVELGGGAEGFAAAGELGSVAVGDQLKVFVENKDPARGRYRLSKEKADRLLLWSRLVHAHDEKETIEGELVGAVEGGYSVDIGVKAFLPGSQLDLHPVRDVESYLNKKLPFRIIKFHKHR